MEIQEIEIVRGDALNQITRAEIDMQIATAHQFPRSMEKFKKRAMEMVSMDEETAASCIYRRPVGKDQDGRQKFAEGLSVRTAEIVGASYGNLRVGAMIIEQSEFQVKARGYAHDLESNFASTSEVIESTLKKDGRPYDARMRIVIAKACLAKARRDVTFQVVPKALCKFIEDTARKVAVGDEKTLSKRRDLAMQWINLKGIDVKRVFAALGIQGESDIGLEQLEMLTGIRTAIKDGDVTLDEAFPENYMPVESTENPEKKDEGYRSKKSYQKVRDGFRSGNWRKVEVPFEIHADPSKIRTKGRMLGELQSEPNVLAYLTMEWEPDEKKLVELAFRAALDAMMEERK
jgi:hypothetical protein